MPVSNFSRAAAAVAAAGRAVVFAGISGEWALPAPAPALASALAPPFAPALTLFFLPAEAGIFSQRAGTPLGGENAAGENAAGDGGAGGGLIVRSRSRGSGPSASSEPSPLRSAPPPLEAAAPPTGVPAPPSHAWCREEFAAGELREHGCHLLVHFAKRIPASIRPVRAYWRSSGYGFVFPQATAEAEAGVVHVAADFFAACGSARMRRVLAGGADGGGGTDLLLRPPRSFDHLAPLGKAGAAPLKESWREAMADVLACPVFRAAAAAAAAAAGGRRCWPPPPAIGAVRALPPPPPQGRFFHELADAEERLARPAAAGGKDGELAAFLAEIRQARATEPFGAGGGAEGGADAFREGDGGRQAVGGEGDGADKAFGGGVGACGVSASGALFPWLSALTYALSWFAPLEASFDSTVSDGLALVSKQPPGRAPPGALPAAISGELLLQLGFLFSRGWRLLGARMTAAAPGFCPWDSMALPFLTERRALAEVGAEVRQAAKLAWCALAEKLRGALSGAGGGRDAGGRRTGLRLATLKFDFDFFGLRCDPTTWQSSAVVVYAAEMGLVPAKKTRNRRRPQRRQRGRPRSRPGVARQRRARVAVVVVDDEEEDSETSSADSPAESDGGAAGASDDDDADDDAGRDGEGWSAAVSSAAVSSVAVSSVGAPPTLRKRSFPDPTSPTPPKLARSSSPEAAGDSSLPPCRPQLRLSEAQRLPGRPPRFPPQPSPQLTPRPRPSFGAPASTQGFASSEALAAYLAAPSSSKSSREASPADAARRVGGPGGAFSPAPAARTNEARVSAAAAGGGGGAVCTPPAASSAATGFPAYESYAGFSGGARDYLSTTPPAHCHTGPAEKWYGGSGVPSRGDAGVSDGRSTHAGGGRWGFPASAAGGGSSAGFSEAELLNMVNDGALVESVRQEFESDARLAAAAASEQAEPPMSDEALLALVQDPAVLVGVLHEMGFAAGPAGIYAPSAGGAGVSGGNY